jgi:hypothetical protein
VIPGTAHRAEHSLAASSQIRVLAYAKGLLTHAIDIGYTPFNTGKGDALPNLPESKRDKAVVFQKMNRDVKGPSRTPIYAAIPKRFDTNLTCI